MQSMSMNANNQLLIDKLEEHNIPLDGLHARGSNTSKEKDRKSGEESEFVKKFMKKGNKR